jgi:putative PIN family toxin of toxin-antitoxin system
MRIAPDSAILVRATKRSAGPARSLFEIIRKQGHPLIVSPFLLQEIARVLNYPRTQPVFRLTGAEIAEFIAELESFAEIYDPVVSEPVVRKDPNDDPIIYTAVVGKADVICTLDRHFYDAPVLEFCRMKNIRVMTDVELLAMLAR